MTRIEELLSRTLLVRDRTMPHDVVPVHEPLLFDNPPPPAPAPPPLNTAAEDLRALCEAVVSHTPATAVADFVTDQVPQPASALVLACVLQLNDTDDGARFWWQYAAGADQPAAAYCLYLHHLARGDRTTADWWHRQTDDAHPDTTTPPPIDPTGEPRYEPHPSTPTFLRILRQLAKQTDRVRTAEVTELMAYVPTAVAAGYLREPDMDLPLPGHDFADKISALLTTAPTSSPPGDVPTRPDPDPGNPNHSRSGQTLRAGHLLPARTGVDRPRPSSALPRCATPRTGGPQTDG